MKLIDYENEWNESNIFEIILACILTGIYLFTVNIRNTRTMCEIYSKLATKTTERLLDVNLCNNS